MMNIENELQKHVDIKFRAFTAKLIPTVNPDSVYGVRTPILRKLAREFFKTPAHNAFLNSLPHQSYEENNIHAFLIEQIKDFDRAIEETEKFLPYIDNWATCDMFRPKVYAKNLDKILPYAEKWIASNHAYTVRYGIGMLLSYFLEDGFSPEILELASSVKSEEYYINMMLAWFFATALAKQYDSTLIYITEKRLSPWVHNKTLQKAVESNRIEKSTKEYLKTLKRKL